MFPKPTKSARLASNISLTPAISRLFEKILVARIHQHLKIHNVLPSTQGGFRPGYNVYDQLLRVISAIQENSYLRHPNIIGLLDIRKAFDSVWHNGLRFKTLGCHFPPNIIKWLSQFLDGRTAQVRVSQHLSALFQLHASVPQGSVIIPLLYMIFTKDTPPSSLQLT